MKILTLNTHTFQHENDGQKLQWLLEAIIRERPDLVALQQVRQSAQAPEAEQEQMTGLIFAPDSGDAPLRRDNLAAQVAAGLRRSGLECNWTWLGVREEGCEGLAVLSLGRKLGSVDCVDLGGSATAPRKALGVRLSGMTDWFYTVQMGAWEDQQAPFADQWQILDNALKAKRSRTRVWLMGGFGGPSVVRGENYDHVLRSGWADTYLLAARRDSGVTQPGIPDQWQDKIRFEVPGLRTDCIWCSRKQYVDSSYVMFNGINAPVVSDHYGVMIDWKG